MASKLSKRERKHAFRSLRAGESALVTSREPWHVHEAYVPGDKRKGEKTKLTKLLKDARAPPRRSVCLSTSKSEKQNGLRFFSRRDATAREALSEGSPPCPLFFSFAFFSSTASIYLPRAPLIAYTFSLRKRESERV